MAGILIGTGHFLLGRFPTALAEDQPTTSCHEWFL